MTRGVTRIGALVALVLTGLVVMTSALPLAAEPVPAVPAPPPSAPAGAPVVPPAPDALPKARIAALTAEADAADSVLAGATARRDRVDTDLIDARIALMQAEAVASPLALAAADAAVRYDASRAELERLAALTYTQSDSLSTLDVLAGASDPLDASRRQLLLDRAGAARRRVVEQARNDRAEARRLAHEADVERRRRRVRVTDMDRAILAADQVAARAQAAATRAHLRLNRWLSVSGGTETPILGASALTPEELAAWFRANRNPPNTTVTIDELTALFVAEGQDEGVRSDIAFAQSLLETGSFSYPGGGLVNGTDNNFAGVGACDSCAHGHVYPDAQTGVRVQMQYLHVYADATMTVSRFAHPPVDPNMDKNFRRGKAPTWSGLTHTWATADGYADSILRVYYAILDWVTAHGA
jgi:hypothetical protein